MRGITHVVNTLGRENEAFEGLTYLSLCVSDVAYERIDAYFERVTHFIHDALAANRHNAVLVHCTRGKSRSATLMAAYLMDCESLTAHEAIRALRDAAGPSISPNPGFMEQLFEHEGALMRSSRTDLASLGSGARSGANSAASSPTMRGVGSDHNLSLRTRARSNSSNVSVSQRSGGAGAPVGSSGSSSSSANGARSPLGLSAGAAGPTTPRHAPTLLSGAGGPGSKLQPASPPYSLGDAGSSIRRVTSAFAMPPSPPPPLPPHSTAGLLSETGGRGFALAPVAVAAPSCVAVGTTIEEGEDDGRGECSGGGSGGSRGECSGGCSSGGDGNAASDSLGGVGHDCDSSSACTTATVADEAFRQQVHHAHHLQHRCSDEQLSQA